MKRLQLAALAAALAGVGWSQTRVDLGKQGTNVDFSGQAFTRPMKVGTSLPGTCTVGDVFFKSNATAGQNIYECQATNTWTQQLNSGGGGGSMFTGSTAVTSAFSATPTFSLADVSVKSPVRFEPAAMTANITSVAFTNKTAGAKFSVVWLQDGTGGRTKSSDPASNTCTISPTASKYTEQFYEVAADGSTVYGIGCVSNDPLDTPMTGPASSTTNDCPKFADTSGVKLADAGVCLLNGGALGTPSGGNASNLDHLPITLTTTGSSGPATWTASTDTLNIPQYSGGGGSAITGTYFPFGRTSSGTQSFSAPTINRTYGWSFIVPSPGISFTKVTLESPSSGTDTGHWAVGFYDSTGALVTNGTSGTFTGDASGSPHTVTMAGTVTLAAGRYHAAFSTDSTGTGLVTVSDERTESGHMANDTLSSPNLDTFYCNNPSTGTTTIVFNAACGTQNAITYGVPPLLVVK